MVVTHRFTLLLVLVVIGISFSSSFSQQVRATNLRIQSFSSDLATLQAQIGYKFNNTNLLRRAMTHASFSQENNKALSIFGTHIIETSVSLRYLTEDIDASSKALSRLVAQVSNVESSCALDGGRLGLGKIIRVSPKTDASNSAILCTGFRAIFGAIAVDAETVDKAINVFWKVHGDRAGRLVSML
ncbi:PREDICTED: protein NUCLEAR FUSION DEFECTIVE 2 isoform X1 [Camelina sativa]|uniref:Protein NUCLEAR FUSION DEFECTIVE 2 isoform X1 n=1 Tax=Camelina sativa TaxID=90675 RepID=A0ABM0VSF8_CAMSA|nr:PREDICTED: protein NUCLEAR FUSION DEFECTIVE 2 isoform X1 [Camelina sativa]